MPALVDVAAVLKRHLWQRAHVVTGVAAVVRMRLMYVPPSRRRMKRLLAVAIRLSKPMGPAAEPVLASPVQINRPPPSPRWLCRTVSRPAWISPPGRPCLCPTSHPGLSRFFTVNTGKSAGRDHPSTSLTITSEFDIIPGHGRTMPCSPTGLRIIQLTRQLR